VVTITVNGEKVLFIVLNYGTKNILFCSGVQFYLGASWQEKYGRCNKGVTNYCTCLLPQLQDKSYREWLTPLAIAISLHFLITDV